MRFALLIILLVSSFLEGRSQGTKKIVPQKQKAFFDSDDDFAAPVS